MAKLTRPTTYDVIHSDTLLSRVLPKFSRNVEEFREPGMTDTQALQRAATWLGSGNFQELYTDAGKLYTVTQTVVFDLNNSSGNCINMKSPIQPADGIGRAFVIQNGRDGDFMLRVFGGGHTDPNYCTKGHASFVDYNEADTVGIQTAFYIRAMRNNRFVVVGTNYKGRVFRTAPLASGQSMKLSFNHLNIRTGDSSAVSGGNCGQAFYLQGDTSAWGKIGTAYINWDAFGSVFDKTVDFTIDHIEFGAAGPGCISGLDFRGVATAHIGSLAGGDETKTNPVVRFISHSDGTQCVGVHARRIFALQGRIGVEFRGSNGASEGTVPNFVVDSIYAEGNSDAGVVLNGCNNSTFQHINSRGNGVNLRLERVTRNVRVHIDSMSSIGSGIVAASGANLDELYITGRVFGNTGAPAVDLSNASVGNVTFNDVQVTAGAGAYSLPVVNLAKLQGGRISLTQGGYFNTGTPSVIKDVEGYVSRKRGTSTIATGGQEVIVTHGLSRAPNEVNIMPTSSAVPFRVYNQNSTTFSVRLASPAVSDFAFTWVANCEYRD